MSSKPLTIRLILADEPGYLMPQIVFKTTPALADELKTIEACEWEKVSDWLAKTAKRRQIVPLVGDPDMTIDVHEAYMSALDKLRGVSE